MKTHTLLSISLLIGLLGGTAGHGADPANCKTFHIKNEGDYRLQPEYIECGTTAHQVKLLRSGEEGTYKVEPGTQIRAEKNLGAGDNSVNIWPHKSDNSGQDIGDGWELTCTGLFARPICIAKTLKPEVCMTFYVKNDQPFAILQPEYTECKTKTIQKPHLNPDQAMTFLVEPNTGVKVEMSMGAGDASKNIWPEHNILKGWSVTCKGNVVDPDCTATPAANLGPVGPAHK